MSENKGYKTCVELKQITSRILKEWYRETDYSRIMLVKRQTFFCCPLTDTLVQEKTCRNCPHNYGDASSREIYCVLDIKRSKSVRTKRKIKGEEKEMVERGEFLTVKEP